MSGSELGSPTPTLDPAQDGVPSEATDSDLVEYLMVGVPDLGSLTSLTPALADLVASATIRILDIVCVARDASNGKLTVLEFENVESVAALQKMDGAVGGLLSEHDIEQASLALEAGSSAILLLVEDRWAESLSAAARQAGGRVVGGERIARSRVEAAIDAMERGNKAKESLRREW